MAKHEGLLPDDFPQAAVKAVTFYLTSSKRHSYYERPVSGPTRLSMVLGREGAAAISERIPAGEEPFDGAAWRVTFRFPRPVRVGPGTKWQLWDGDKDKLSAVNLHSSDVDAEGLPGTAEIFGCNYAKKRSVGYSVDFQLVAK
jgi:hypothetical protein